MVGKYYGEIEELVAKLVKKHRPNMLLFFSNHKPYDYRGGSSIQNGGGGYNYIMHGNCGQSTQSGMQSMPNLGGLGACPPPENFGKIKPSEIESEGIFNGLLSLLLQDSTLHSN